LSQELSFWAKMTMELLQSQAAFVQGLQALEPLTRFHRLCVLRCLPTPSVISHLTTAAATAAAATIATLGDVKSRLSAAAAAPRRPLRWKDGSGMIVIEEK
jgi:hypothetical protein